MRDRLRNPAVPPIECGVGTSSQAVDGALDGLIAGCYGNHDGLAERAADLVARAEATGDRRNADLGRLVLAELDARNGRVPEGLARAGEILVGTDDRVVVAKAHAVIANGLWRAGDNGEAVRHAYTASRMLTEGDPPALRVDHAILLAVQVNDQRGGAISHEEFRFAQELAEACGRPALIQANLNNWAWCCYVRGDLPRAVELARQMQDNSTVTGEPINLSSADTVARILLETGDPAEATRVIERAITTAPATDADAVPAALVTLAEIQQRGGDVHAALRTLDRVRALAARDDLAEHAAVALRMLAACHAELGDFRTAYQEMVDFHAAWTVRRSEKSEVVARVAHAQFAVDEAERTTERFREMAERDALTGLWNRRRSDAELAALLAVPAGHREPVCVAIVDLDHFKQINDSCSHTGGDEVLRRVAGLLAAAPGHAARHGGEEFLLILPGGLGPAARACEEIRAALAAYDWRAVADGLRVTASIGLTPLLPEDDALSVVRRADDLLYTAKHGGRNRVVAG